MCLIIINTDTEIWEKLYKNQQNKTFLKKESLKKIIIEEGYFKHSFWTCYGYK